MIERYGVPPELVTDLMGLRGDTSDNIPGVPGIGEKTATQLLQKFGSLEEVLASVDEISGAKRKQNLVEHADDARMSKQLATLQYDIETGVDLAAAMASEPDRGALRDFMREFELRAVMERLEEALPEGEAVPGRSVETELEVEAVEGTPADLGDGPGRAGDRRRALGRRRRRADRRRRARPWTSWRSRWPARPLVAHDVKSLGGGRHGLLAAAAREGVELELDHDTMVAAYLLEPQRRTYELTELAADAGIGLAEGAAGRRGDDDDGQLSLGEEVEAGLDPAEEARLVAALAEVQRPRIEELGPGAAAARGRAAAGPRAGGDGARGAEARRRAPRRGRRRLRRADRHAGEGDLRAGRGGVHDRLAAAGRPQSSSRSSG